MPDHGPKSNPHKLPQKRKVKEPKKAGTVRKPVRRSA